MYRITDTIGGREATGTGPEVAAILRRWFATPRHYTRTASIIDSLVAAAERGEPTGEYAARLALTIERAEVSA